MANVKFSMTYLALKMFGKQLYANMSAALAELVANGLDANAENVYVFMDLRNKKHATIAIYDDGHGMNYDNMSTDYAVIGRNKREQLSPEEAGKKMGRKGIGKLAALYLSDTYYVISKTFKDKKPRAWLLDVGGISNDDFPELVEKAYPFEKGHIFQEELENKAHGTIILLKDVFVKNFGQAAEEALEQKLANYFLVNNLKQSIKVCILKDDGQEIVFKEVEKNIAYENMAYIYTTDTESFSDIKNKLVFFHDKDLKTESKLFEMSRHVVEMPEEIEARIKDETGKSQKVKNKIKDTILIDGKEYTYELKGWIGVHSSIEYAGAELNCNNFRKNMFYNPNQLRIYVRNKLAASNFLSHLGITAAFLNYIEGEISFDILDIEELDDIATAGRDDFSIQDERVKLLIELCKGIVSKLVSDRQSIASAMKANRENVEEQIKNKEAIEIKEKFQNGAIESKVVLDSLRPEEKQAIENDYVQFARAANLSSPTDLIFISHKTDCKEFGSFLIDIFTRLYPPIKNRIVFSSHTDFGIPQGANILDYLRECFREDLHVVFLLSKSFYDSNVCLAEAGAAWSTNKKYSNFVIDMGFGHISDPLDRNQKGARLVNLHEEDFQDISKEVIRIFESVKVPEKIDFEKVLAVVKDSYEKHKDKLVPEPYFPKRDFQGTPKCEKCNHPMNLEWKNNQLMYACACGNEFVALIKE